MNSRIERQRTARRIRLISVGGTVGLLLLFRIILPLMKMEYTVISDWLLERAEELSLVEKKAKQEKKVEPQPVEKPRPVRTVAARTRSVRTTVRTQSLPETSQNMPSVLLSDRSPRRQGRTTELRDVSVRTDIAPGAVEGLNVRTVNVEDIGGGNGRDVGGSISPGERGVGRDRGAVVGSALAPGGGSVPSLTGSGDQVSNVIIIPRETGGSTRRPDNAAIIDWIEKHQKALPYTLRGQENLDQKPGDVTTWLGFEDGEGNKYTLYLLGRRGVPPLINIFLVKGGKGTLLVDQGIKSVSALFKHGSVWSKNDDLVPQLNDLPPGDAKAKQMMNVFNAWWSQTQAKER
ncbi:hypothetical protein KKH27_09490 [bacterium]|nr:hypothetical protein [bacterium]MBU1983863.1 hypothetical protein [bacterium]